VRERVSPATGHLERVDQAHCRLLTGGNSLSSLVVWIALIGFEFSIEEPPELIAELEAVQRRLARSLRGA
jgi:hypothetical protein